MTEITKEYLLAKREQFAKVLLKAQSDLGVYQGAIAAVNAILQDLEKSEDWSASKPIDIAPPIDEPQYGADTR